MIHTEIGQVGDRNPHPRPFHGLDELLRDTAYSLRKLRNRPGFTLAVVLSLAFCIGANTAIFSLLDALLWRLLPVDRPEELWTIGDGYRYQEFRALAEDTGLADTMLAGVAAYGSVRLDVRIDGSPEPAAEGQLVSGGYFSLLGVNAIAGRTIGPEDDRVPNGDPVAMLSDGYWSRRFGRDPSTIGRVISISGTPFTVIGVTPPKFFGVEVGTAPDVYVPVTMQPAAMPTMENLLESPIIDRQWLHVLVRLRPGVSPDQATAAMEPVVRTSFLSWPDGQMPSPQRDDPRTRGKRESIEAKVRGLRPTLTPASTGLCDLRKRYSRPLFVLMALVGVLLLIGCANTANLLLARAATLRRELATRLALGAGRWRLMRQLLVESVLLAALGGVAGVLLAGWTTRLLVAFISRGRTPIVLNLDPDLRVLTFTLTVSVLTGLLFGLVPAVRETGIKVGSALRGLTGMSGRSGLVIDRLLAVCQIALSLVLLIGAGLFVRSLAALDDRDSGFPRDSVLVARVEPQGSDQRGIEGTSERLDRIYRDLIRRVEAVPGVRSASLAQFTPTNRTGVSKRLRTPSGEEVRIHIPMIYPGYFTTLGIPILAGRDFETRDLDTNVQDRETRTSQQHVAIVNETFAHQFWPGASALGRSCGSVLPTDPPCEIIGIVKDSAYADFRGEIVATRYQPFLQTRTGRGQMALYVRFAGDFASMIPLIRREVARLTPGQPLFEVRTLADEVDAVLVGERLIATLASVFGGIALLLGCVGLYGLLAFAMARRTAEVGLRVALGAGRGDIVRLVMREASALVVAGVAVGMAVGLAASRVAGSQISGLLFGLEAVDPLTIAGACVVLVLVAMVAAYLPARRASRVDPMVALRTE